MTTSNEMAILKSEAETAFMAVLTVGKHASDQLARARSERDPVAESMAMAFGMTALQDAIKSNPQAVTVLMRMAGHRWGFKTDQDAWDGGGTNYKPDVVVPCFCEAMMNQLRPVGNEFNIITSSTYTTKEGWGGLLARLPGVTEVDARAGSIVDFDAREFETKQGKSKKKITASVSATADCKVWGQFVQVRSWNTPDADERLQLSVIASEIDEALDQLKGKADARILERLHHKVVALSLAGPQGVPQSEQSKPAARIETATPVVEMKQETKQASEQEAKDTEIREKVSLTNQKTRAEKMLEKDESALSAFRAVWASVETAGSAEALNEVRIECRPTVEMFSESIQTTLRKHLAHCSRKLETKNT